MNDKSKQQVAKPKEPGLPAHLTGYQSSGAGVPTDQKDFLIPMARVLDPKSPEVEKRGASYVTGAEPGDIFIKNAPTQIVKGETGFLFQPCYRDAAVVEWTPRHQGGGYVTRHPENFIEKSGDAIQKPHPEQPEKQVWYRKSTGNLLVETRYYGGYLISENNEQPPMPLVLTFQSTGHTVAKQWNMLLASKRINGKAADIWTVFYRVKTRLKERRDQAWYLFDITDAGPQDAPTMWVPSIQDLERGKALHDSLASGAKQFETEPHVEDEDKKPM